MTRARNAGPSRDDALSEGAGRQAEGAATPRRRRRAAAPPDQPVDLGPVGDVLRLLEGPACVMTARFEGSRAGLLVRSCLPCADEPVLIAVAIRKGHRIDPLVRDSRAFALCVLRPDDRATARRFADTGDDRGEAREPRESEAEDLLDVFDAMRTLTLLTGSPVLRGCRAALDCEVVRHVDLDADHALYVGQVLKAVVMPG